ncbi:hypothetical protein [Prosthecobacter sp.]|uniref:hypothetical protein n=1 Tax=Prosthecobacter sp. TaxID=1965333 RepID=UPI003783E358
MKSALRLVALIGGQMAVVLLLARVVRCKPVWLDDVSVNVWAACVYGIPAILGFLCGLRFVRLPPAGWRGRVLSVGASLLGVFVGFHAGIVVLQQSDMWLTSRYIQRMQAQLRADARFKEVRLIGYSCDFILFPYIPVGGSVASEEDRKELNRLLKAGHPPGYAHGGSYLVRKVTGVQ